MPLPVYLRIYCQRKKKFFLAIVCSQTKCKEAVNEEEDDISHSAGEAVYVCLYVPFV